MLEHRPKPEALIPRDIDHAIVPCEGKEDARVIIAGVPVSLTLGIKYIEVVVEGHMPAARQLGVAEAIRTNAEATVQRRCILEQM